MLSICAETVKGFVGVLPDTPGRGESEIRDQSVMAKATAEAIRLLKGRGAGMLIHLGDFCDSIRHNRTAAMIDLLRVNGVLAVKGNNDFFVEHRLADARRPPDAEGISISAFLRDLPVVRSQGDIRFAHSFPFEELFTEADFRILFCGHSHLPILFRKSDGRVMREPVPAERPVELERTARYIFIAGAASDGECALYDEEAGTYVRIRTKE
jgi:predicted phosphodiesterase